MPKKTDPKDNKKNIEEDSLVEEVSLDSLDKASLKKLLLKLIKNNEQM